MPRGFNFRFQQLLDIASFEEDGIKNRLTAKNLEIAELENKIQKYIDDHDNALKEQEHDLMNGNFEKVQLYPAYLAVLKKSQVFYEKERDRQIKQREKIMEELLEKQRQRKTYEVLKEKDLNSFKKEQLKKEQKILDEFGKKSVLTLDEE